MGNGHEKQADSEGGKTKMNRIEDVTNYITECDKEIGEALSLELGRQRRNLELIASENIVSPAVMLAMGTVPTNKYAEGYPGKRYYGGCEDVTFWRIWQSKEQKNCSDVNMHVYSHIQEPMPILQCIRHFWN